MNADDIISTAKARIAFGAQPMDVFYASILLRMRYVNTTDVPTMAIDGRTIFYNPAFVEPLGVEGCDGVLKHEAMHVVTLTHLRRNHREPLLWNIATDLSINEILKEGGVKLPDSACFPGVAPFASHEANREAEWHYNHLPRNKQITFISIGDVLDAPGSDSEAGRSQAEAEAKVLIAGAVVAARKRGTLPASIDRLAAEALGPPKAAWQDILREFITSYAKNDYCWSAPNRKLLQQGVYAPGIRSEELGDILLAVDTSGSIGDETLKSFASEMNGILDAYDCTATILYCDAKVHRVDSWRSTDGLLVLQPVGGGGTSHAPIWEWAAENQFEPACCVCLTDLYTDFGEEPPFPVLWCVVDGGKADPPFGRVIEVEA